MRLSIRKGDVLRFLSDLTVPFTNNVAEQAARMMKLRQKISGGFRSAAGAANFAVIRSLLATARKQGWKMLDTLAADPKRLLADLKSASYGPTDLASYGIVNHLRDGESLGQCAFGPFVGRENGCEGSDDDHALPLFAITTPQR